MLKSILFLGLLLNSAISVAAEPHPYVDGETLGRIEKKYKMFAKKRFYFQQKTLDSVTNASEKEKLKAVNDFYNQVRYAKDIVVYHKKDYWATPYEFLGHDKGDCEDYVIAKYFALKYLGVNPKKMYFTYVRSTRFKAPHMVLTYFETPKSIPLVLDNANFRIFPANKRKDLKPVYLFNASTLYKQKKKNKIKNPKVHKKWDQLIQNIKRKKI